MTKLIKRGLVVVAAGCLLYLGTYIYVANSEAFRFSQSWLEQSQSVKTAVGDDRSYRLSPWGGFREHFAGNRTKAWLDIRVTGTRGSITVRLELLKTDDIWTVVNSGVV